MPKPGCNGFSMFAEQMRPHLEKKLGRQLPRFSDLLREGSVYWRMLSDDEKQEWKLRGRIYKNSNEFAYKKREARLNQLEKLQMGLMRVSNTSSSNNNNNNREEDTDESIYESEHEHVDDDFADPFELPAPIEGEPSCSKDCKFEVSETGSFRWKTEMTPAEMGELHRSLATLASEDRAQQQANVGFGGAPSIQQVGGGGRRHQQQHHHQGMFNTHMAGGQKHRQQQQQQQHDNTTAQSTYSTSTAHQTNQAMKDMLLAQAQWRNSNRGAQPQSNKLAGQQQQKQVQQARAAYAMMTNSGGFTSSSSKHTHRTHIQQWSSTTNPNVTGATSTRNNARQYYPNTTRVYQTKSMAQERSFYSNTIPHAYGPSDRANTKYTTNRGNDLQQKILSNDYPAVRRGRSGRYFPGAANPIKSLLEPIVTDNMAYNNSLNKKQQHSPKPADVLYSLAAQAPARPVERERAYGESSLVTQFKQAVVDAQHTTTTMHNDDTDDEELEVPVGRVFNNRSQAAHLADLDGTADVMQSDDVFGKSQASGPVHVPAETKQAHDDGWAACDQLLRLVEDGLTPTVVAPTHTQSVPVSPSVSCTAVTARALSSVSEHKHTTLEPDYEHVTNTGVHANMKLITQVPTYRPLNAPLCVLHIVDTPKADVHLLTVDLADDDDWVT